MGKISIGDSNMGDIMVVMKLKCLVKKSGDIYVSHCPQLDVYSQGPTKEKAISNLADASSLFVLSCYKRGVLDNVLHQCGWTANEEKKPAKTTTSRKREISIDVSVPFTYKPSNSRSAQVCHA